MATSPTHRFGQIIGDRVEYALRAPLETIAKKHRLYLDFRHPRAARDDRTKVAWLDNRGNRHDLDYVLEQGGTEATLGKPRAFIEIAYRRYTKHSRNKAQEIQGAIAPLAETYSSNHPFLGVVLAGVFTTASITQLRSHGFGVLYFPFSSILKAFQSAGIDAAFDEDSTDADVLEKVQLYLALDEASRNRISARLRQIHKKDFTEFLDRLELVLSRAIATVTVLALHGAAFQMASLPLAIRYIQEFDESTARHDFVRYEVSVRYTNNDEVRGSFASKFDAIQFLETL